MLHLRTWISCLWVQEPEDTHEKETGDKQEGDACDMDSDICLIFLSTQWSPTRRKNHGVAYGVVVVLAILSFTRRISTCKTVWERHLGAILQRPAAFQGSRPWRRFRIKAHEARLDWKGELESHYHDTTVGIGGKLKSGELKLLCFFTGVCVMRVVLLTPAPRPSPPRRQDRLSGNGMVRFRL